MKEYNSKHCGKNFEEKLVMNDRTCAAQDIEFSKINCADDHWKKI